MNDCRHLFFHFFSIQRDLLCIRLPQGEVEVLIDDEVVLTIMQGGTFGELALIHGTPRAATVRALNTVNLWVLDRSLSYTKIKTNKDISSGSPIAKY